MTDDPYDDLAKLEDAKRILRGTLGTLGELIDTCEASIKKLDATDPVIRPLYTDDELIQAKKMLTLFTRLFDAIEGEMTEAGLDPFRLDESPILDRAKLA